jgi:methylenetetrahydrofolate reductase (NADPH)
MTAEEALTRLKAKIDHGAEFVITQLFFDNDDYYRYVEDAKRVVAVL